MAWWPARPWSKACSGPAATSGPQGGPGYGAGADRTVLLRWFATQPDPVVKVGDFIADVTYERSQTVVLSRFFSNNGAWLCPTR